MKRTWTQEIIENLIAARAEESVHLEFKEGHALNTSDRQKMEICKDVSAFANSDGGQIVYGVKENNHKADVLSPVDGNVITKEWLENIISSGIHQRVDSIIITPIRWDGDISKTVFIVDIPASDRAPHMANGRFYKRYNFKSMTMEEYEVRHLYMRKQKTTLELGQALVRINNSNSWEIDGYLNVSVTYHVKNVGATVAEKYRLRCSLPRFTELQYDFVNKPNYGFSVADKVAYVFVKECITLYPEEEIAILNFSFKLLNSNLDWLQDLFIKVTLFTDNGNKGFTHQIGNTLQKLVKEFNNEKSTSIIK